MSNFDDAFVALMGNEDGNTDGYSNDPNDPGGETMHGITARVARKWGYTGAMHDLPLETAKEIAKKEYWDKYDCDALPAHTAFQVFDCAYNGGHPVQWLQRAAGVPEDGVIGPKTIAAVNAMDEDKLIMRFDAYRLHFLADLNNWPHFGKGWAIRIADNLLRATK